MTEQNQPTKNIGLNPLYEPAKHDTVITIHFIGNTPVVSHYDSYGMTPYHMLAAPEDMKRKAFQMIQLAEIKEAQAQKQREEMGIKTATKIPQSGLPPGGFDLGG